MSVRNYFIALLLCGIFFIFPFQVYIIGSETGIGIQGAVFRYQITSYGNSLIPITSDMMYIIRGIYSSKTALSVLVWILGTLLLTATTIFGLIFAAKERSDFNRQISLGLVSVCLCYLISCIVQYGFIFSGPAGTSLPVGIVILIGWIAIMNLLNLNFFKT